MNKNINIPDVLIAGAGPTGLMTACQLSLYGIPFRIIDKKQYPAAHSGAMIIHARTLEIFQQMELAEEMIMSGRVVNGISIYFNGKLKSRLNLSDKAMGVSAFPYILMLEQSKTEQLLLKFLQQRGHEVEWETELVDLTLKELEVEAIIRLRDGNLETVNPKYLVGADGGKSRVRSLLNVPFKGSTHNIRLMVMECVADVELPAGELSFFFTKQATAGFFPLTDGRWRIDASFQHIKSNKHQLSFDEIAGVFNRKINFSANIRDPQWFSVFYSHGRHASHFMLNRCFLTGDAAHLFTPVGGQGMNTGLQDAYNLAWKMALVLKNQMVPQALETYETERNPVALRIYRISDRYFRLAASGRLHLNIFRISLLPLLLKLFFRIMDVKFAGDYIFKKISGVGLSYKLNLLNVDASKNIYITAPKPGNRLPYCSYKENGKVVSVQQKVHSTRFLLLIFGDRTNAGLLQTAVKDYLDVLTTLFIPFGPETSELYVLFGINSEGWYLIRPDMYIACRSDGPGAEELKDYLHTLFVMKRYGKPEQK